MLLIKYQSRKIDRYLPNEVLELVAIGLNNMRSIELLKSALNLKPRLGRLRVLMHSAQNAYYVYNLDA